MRAPPLSAAVRKKEGLVLHIDSQPIIVSEEKMSEMASEIQLLRWLEISGALASLKEQSILHRTSKKVVTFSSRAPSSSSIQSQMVYRLSLHLDPLDLLQFNGIS